MLFQRKQDDSLKTITENLYRQNAELAVKNKTLSLLSRLYEISIMSLDIKKLSREITRTIQAGLELELAGIMLFDSENDSLIPLSFFNSDRLHNEHLSFDEKVIIKVSHNPFFSPVFSQNMPAQVSSLKDIWGNLLPANMSDKLGVHIKDSLVYPLSSGDKVIGVLILSLNRTYESLQQYEKDSISSFINVIAVAIDKAILYEELKVSNTKLANANIRLQELDQQKTEFISLATHQIRGPLGAIKGHASLALEGDYGPLADGPKKAFETIIHAAQGLVVVVNDYLDVSRIEQGKMKYDFSDFDLKDLAKEVVNEFLPTLAHKQLTLDLSCDQILQFPVHADRGKIKQVLGNLIDNSIKYTPEGHIRVCVEKKGDKVLFSVKDNGVGIKPEVLPNLFVKFSRAPDASKTNILGTGLGLFVAKKMIEAHKGRIWAESEGAGKGSQFYVELQEKN
jgi:signal transduction histidine kinase